MKKVAKALLGYWQPLVALALGFATVCVMLYAMVHSLGLWSIVLSAGLLGGFALIVGAAVSANIQENDRRHHYKKHVRIKGRH
jgi:hypothetical protein